MAESNGFSMGFDTRSISDKITAYQSKLLDIAKANMELSFSYAQAITTVKSPTEFTTISSDFSRKQVELLKSQAKELAEFAIPKQA